ncbi:hypothetical protein [Burkholderia anthina]|uniref:hypothetical protein n=1 Tax=Burkholderia anthina TaxID=179879 RepID=UPI0037C146DA
MNRNQQRTSAQRWGRRHIPRAAEVKWTRQIEEDLFVHCASVFTKAQQQPKSTAAAHGIRTINDLPSAGGLLAVLHDPALQRRDGQTRAAIWWRLVSMLELAATPGRLLSWVGVRDASGAVQFAEVLVRACATARLPSAEVQDGGFDADELVLRVAAIEARELSPVAA